MPDRGAVFIDAAYLDYVRKDVCPNGRIDYWKFSDNVCPGTDLLRTYYYNCPPFVSNTPTPDERERQKRTDSFYHALRRLPRFEVRLGKLAKRQCRDCGASKFEQKRVDILLSVDLVHLAARQRITHAHLVAGDSDFIPAVIAAKNEGVLVHLWHGEGSHRPHGDLFEACDERNALTRQFLEGCDRG